MKLFISLSTILMAINFIAGELKVVNQEIRQLNSQLQFKGAAIDEVVVQSSLTIKPKQQRPQLRRVRKSISSEFNVLASLIEQNRVKRQVDDYSQSQAAAFQNYNSLHEFGHSAANAPAQAFNVEGPAAAFGASAAGNLKPASHGHSNGVQDSAGASHPLTFKLPNGKSIKFASTSSIGNGPEGNNANSRANAVSVNRI